MPKNHTDTPGLSTNGTAPGPRGRPRNPQNTLLIEALIGRQDAMSRRTARRINEILDAHVNVGAAAFVWARMCRTARAKFAEFIERACATIRPGDPVYRDGLTQLVAEVIEDLRDDLFGPAPAKMPPEEPRPRATVSRTLAEARAQSANLAVRLMDLKARITPIDQVLRHRGDAI